MILLHGSLTHLKLENMALIRQHNASRRKQLAVIASLARGFSVEIRCGRPSCPDIVEMTVLL